MNSKMWGFLLIAGIILVIIGISKFMNERSVSSVLFILSGISFSIASISNSRNRNRRNPK